MKAVILGAVGALGVHASAELISSKLFDELILADVDVDKTRRMAAEWGVPREWAVALDAADERALQSLMSDNPAVVVNALPKNFVLNVAKAAIATRARVIDLSSLKPELRALDDAAHAAGAIYVAGCGASSGLTNMLAKHGARGLDEVDSIEISFASFRAIALSPASIDGVFWEFSPNSVRGYYADGKYHRVELWASAQEVDFPEPFGRQTVYIVPHSEPHTLSRNLNAKRVVVRGTFTPKVMRLVRVLSEYGFFKNEDNECVLINNKPIARRDLIKRYLVQVPEANEEPLWGYALHVEVTGRQDGHKLRRTLWTTHPSSDKAGWAGRDAWERCVALPLVAGSLLIANDKFVGEGIDAPEAFFPAIPFITELLPRGIHVHEKVTELE